MKRFIGPLLTLCLAFGVANSWTAGAAEAGVGAKSSTVLRFHSKGLREWTRDNSGRVFKEIWTLPASVQVRREILDKMAILLAGSFESKSGGPGESGKLLRPLLNDLPDAEWALELLEDRPDLLESTLAIRVDDARSRVWQSTWSQLLPSRKLRAGLQTEAVTTFTTNGWFIVHTVSGPTASSDRALLLSSVVKRIQQGQSPLEGSTDYWLSLDADLAALARWTGAPIRPNQPRVQLMVDGRKEYLRSTGQLHFPQPLGFAVQKWEIPSGMIRDPLISFTAIQGVAPWLKQQPMVLKLAGEQTPSQVYFWGSSQTAFQIQAAVPIPSGATWFERILEQWVPKFNATLKDYAVGKLSSLPDRAEIVWRGLPLLVPYLERVRDGNREFLHAGIFPVDPPTNAPPPQLFHQLTSQTNLVYYDWEITQARLVQLRSLHQLAGVFLDFSAMSTNSGAFKWLDAIEPRLGNSVTEMTMTSPRDLQFQRTSHMGLNGLELLGVAAWIEGTNFPKLNLKTGFRPVARSTK